MKSRLVLCFFFRNILTLKKKKKNLKIKHKIPSSSLLGIDKDREALATHTNIFFLFLNTEKPKKLFLIFRKKGG
ncbi:hypothetical protein CW304_01110 [Bacillus sp. UFRGS-B20]|nr:hypothetical protein CW304_01110 [Bacillus sp. UFRGS-B20]